MNDMMQRYFKRNDKVTFRDFGSECILLHLESGCYYTLNGVGRFIWQQLNPCTQLASVHAAIQDHFSVNTKQAESDLNELIDHLLSEDLIVADAGSAG